MIWHMKIVPGLSQDCPRIVPGLSQDCPKIVLGLSQNCPRIILNIFKNQIDESKDKKMLYKLTI